jgi:tryptophan-rich hypothetical protein
MPPTISKKQFEINATWTAVKPRSGWRHYRIAGRRKAEHGLLEIEMMSVCDRSVRFWIPKEELQKSEIWLPGWKEGIADGN